MEEALVKRVLPHSVEAEQSVIGAMLMDRDAIIAASESVVADEFYQRQYGVMFETMVELFNEGKPVDLVTLQNRLKEKDVPPEVCSLDVVRDIMATVPTSANVRSYATIVHEKAVLRRLIKINEEIANTCYAGKEPSGNDPGRHGKADLQPAPEPRLPAILCRSARWRLNVLDKIEQATRSKSTVTGLPTGFIDLDYRMSGPPAVGPDPDRRPPVHGKDGLCTEYSGLYRGAPTEDLSDFQSGDVQGAAGEPYACPWSPTWIPRSCGRER